MYNGKKMKKKIIFWTLACFLFIIALHSLHYHTNKQGLIGNESFQNINSLMHEEKEGWYETLISLLGEYLGVETSAIILVIFSIVGSLIFFALIIDKIENSKNVKHFALFFLIISPLFIYSSTVIQPYSLLSLLYLATIYFFFLEKPIKYIGSILSALMAFLEPILFVIFILPLFFHFLKKKENNTAIAVAALISFISFLVSFEKKSITGNNISFVGLLESNIVMFGALKGFTFLAIFTIIIAFIFTWKDKKKNVPFYLLFILAILGSIFIDESYKIILNFFAAYLSAYGFWRITSMRWELYTIKNILYVLIILGMLVSGIFYISTLFSTSPSENTIRALHFIKGNTNEHEKIFSDPSKEHWIIYFTGNEIYTGNQTADILRTRNNRIATGFMEEQNISLILVDDHTRELMIRDDNNIGLEFVMENSDNFKKMVRYDHTVVWGFRN